MPSMGSLCAATLLVRAWSASATDYWVTNAATSNVP